MAAAVDHGIEYGKIFGSWQIRELIGTGSKGRTKVYRITKDAQGGMEAGEERALKAVTICEDADLEKMTLQARTEYDVNRDFLCEKARSEVQMMKRLEGASHIVGYLDWEIRDRTGGTDLLIAMHLLETLEVLQKRRDVFHEEEVLQVGMDICEALVWCQKEGIIHRDIKPANIFRRPDGRGGYLLGDFGVSRIVDNGMGASTDIGTPAYAAPEQVRSAGGYHSQVDVYSLGVVLYELSNRNRLPFADSRYGTREMINRRVIFGEGLPIPADASPALANVILKACAFRSEDRFQTAQELWDALKGIQAADVGIAIPKPPEDSYATVPLEQFVPTVLPVHQPDASPVSLEEPLAERRLDDTIVLPGELTPEEQPLQESPEKSVPFGKNEARKLFTDDMVRALSKETDENDSKGRREKEIACTKIQLDIPEGFTVIETGAFEDLFTSHIEVGRIILPNTVREIQKDAFRGVWIAEFIEIPDSVQTICDLPGMYDAYVICSESSPARRFKKREKEQYQCYTKEQGKPLTRQRARVLAAECDGKQLTIPEEYGKIEEFAFMEYSDFLPEGYRYKAPVSESADCKELQRILERVIVPDTVTYIKDHALCGLAVYEYIEVPRSVRYIGKDAFTLQGFAYVKCEKGTYAYGTCKRRGIPTSWGKAVALRTFGSEQAKKQFSKLMSGDEIELAIPDDYVILDSDAFFELRGNGEYLIVDRVILPQSMTTIKEGAFDGLIISNFIEIADSVVFIYDFPYLGPDAYVKCRKDSAAHRYCREHQIKNSVDDEI